MNICSVLLQVTLLVVLGTGSFMDIKDNSLPVWFLAAAAIPGIVIQAVTGEMAFYRILLGCACGMFLLGVSLMSRQAIGYGDAVMFIISGIYLGFEMNVLLMLFSLTISAIASMILMVRLRLRKNSQIPFLPFMLSGYICLLPVMGL